MAEYNTLFVIAITYIRANITVNWVAIVTPNTALKQNMAKRPRILIRLPDQASLIWLAAVKG